MMSQNCYRHPDILARTKCSACGQPICATCIEQWCGQAYCLPDYALARHPHVTKPNVALIGIAPSASPATPFAGIANIYPLVNHAAQMPTDRSLAAAHRIVAPLTNPEGVATDAPASSLNFGSLLWSVLGLISAATEVVVSLSFFRLLGAFYDQRNSHSNSYVMQMTLFQVFVFIFLVCVTALYNGAIVLMQRSYRQPRTSLRFRQRSPRIHRPTLSLLFSGFALILCAVAIIVLLGFISSLQAIPEGLQCCF